jgi:RNA polymerase sigma-70 factor (ECF subfamily)
MSDFHTTQWSMVVAAGETGSSESRIALETLCETYWYPLYVYARRRGHDEDDARDLTQGFFAKLLEKNWVGDADPARGKFRTFMLTALKHYMLDEWDRQRAQKRGGGALPLSLDFDTAEDGFKLELPDDRTPEDVFDACWADTLMQQARERLRREMLEPGKEDRFERLEGFVTGEGKEVPYKEVAEELGLSESAVKVAVYRMRRRFGEILRAEVADTVGDPADVEPEIRHLLALLVV